VKDGWREYYWPLRLKLAVFLVLFYGGIEVGVTIGYVSGRSPSPGIVALLVALIVFVVFVGWRLWHVAVLESTHGLTVRGFVNRQIACEDIAGFSTRWESPGAPKVVIARRQERRPVTLYLVQDKTTRWNGGESTDIVGVLASAWTRCD
jgi:xanthosine utilization system XapX-like protein